MKDQYGKWSEDQIKQVWAKGRLVTEYDPNEYRQDIAGALMRYSEYGNTDDEFGFGWEIDHRRPESLGGTDDISNFRPLQWSNNRSKSDNYPEWTSVVSFGRDKNIRKFQRWVLN